MPEETDQLDYLIDRIHDLLDKKEYSLAAAYAERLKKVKTRNQVKEPALL